MIIKIKSVSFSSWAVKVEVSSTLGEITQTILGALDPSLDWGPLMDHSSNCGTLRGLSSDWEFLMDLSSYGGGGFSGLGGFQGPLLGLGGFS